MEDREARIETMKVAVSTREPDPYPDIETADERRLKEEASERMVEGARKYVDNMLRAKMMPPYVRELYALAEKLSVFTQEPVKAILERAVREVGNEDPEYLRLLLQSWIEKAARGDTEQTQPAKRTGMTAAQLFAAMAAQMARPLVQPRPRHRPDAQEPKARKQTNREKRIARARRAKGRRK